MPLPAAGYEFDVFFSYKRHALSIDWTRRVSTLFKFYLSHELNVPEARVFVDEESIELGEPWPEALQRALRRSKCLVCIWSPLYFQSDWCCSEWRSFQAREKMLAEGETARLIAPLKFHDGEHFPQEAQSVQWTDVSKYNSTLSAFWSSARALELEDILKSFSADVAQMVRNAPAFRDNWPVVSGHGLVRPKIELAKL